LLPFGADGIHLGGHMEVLEDKAGSLSFAEVRQSDGFRPLSGNLAAGFTRSAFWLRFTLTQPADGGGPWLIEMGLPFLDHLDLYQEQPDGTPQVTRGGGELPLSARPIAYRDFVYPLIAPEAGQQRRYYLRIWADHTLAVYPTLWRAEAFRDHVLLESLGLGLLHGAALVIAGFVCLQFLVNRDRLMGLFALYVVCIEFWQICNNGLTAWLLLPNQPHLSGMLVSITGCAAIAFGALLSSALLGLKQERPWLHRAYMLVALLVVGAVIAVPLGLYPLVAGPVQLAGMLMLVTQMLLASLMALRGNRQGWLYLAGFGMQLISATTLILRNLGKLLPWAPHDLDPPVQLALLCHLLFLGYGLARKYKDIARANAALMAEVEVRQQYEASLIEAREKAEVALGVQQQAVREQRNFLAMVSHEFRTPLATISAAAEMMEALALRKAAGAEKELAKVRRATIRMTGLIDTCLADEWLESTLSGLDRQDVDLAELLSTVCDEILHLSNRQVDLAIEAKDCVLFANKELLRILFQNLLGNAVKYTPAQSRIWVRLCQSMGAFQITVSDDGSGIPPEIRSKIFEKFFRGDNVNGGSGGAGLGLYLVQRIAQRHGGAVTLEPMGKRGTSFLVNLPNSYSSIDGI